MINISQALEKFSLLLKRKPKSDSRCLTDLPDEILVLIFLELDIRTLLELRLVNTTLRSISADQKLWRARGVMDRDAYLNFFRKINITIIRSIALGDEVEKTSFIRSLRLENEGPSIGCDFATVLIGNNKLQVWDMPSTYGHLCLRLYNNASLAFLFSHSVEHALQLKRQLDRDVNSLPNNIVTFRNQEPLFFVVTNTETASALLDAAINDAYYPIPAFSVLTKAGKSSIELVEEMLARIEMLLSSPVLGNTHTFNYGELNPRPSH